MTAVKCPVCTDVSFTDSQSLLEHFTPCIMEKYHDHQSPDPFFCAMCKTPLPCLVDAISHVRTCGNLFCGFVFTQSSTTIKTVPTSVILGHEPKPPSFNFPDDDPFSPSPTEMLRRSQLTARFLLMVNYFDTLTQTGPILIASWDFIYHRHMKRAGPKNMVSRHVSPNRGINYTPEKHVMRRLDVLSNKYTDSDVKDICRLDRELGMDYASVARMYMDLFVFQHFKESIAILQEWDHAVHPPNGSGKYDSHRNLYSMTDVRANARYHLVHNGNAIFFQILDSSYSRVRFALNCDNTMQTLGSWINTGRNITVIERSSKYPPVGNFLVRTIKDVIDQHGRVLYHRNPKKNIRKIGIVGAFGGKSSVGAIGVSKRSHTTSSPSSSRRHQTLVTDNDSVSAMSQATFSSSSSPCPHTNPLPLSLVSPCLNGAVNNAKEKERLEFIAERDTTASLSLAILHNNNEVATGGMDYVKTPTITFPDIESNHCFSNNTGAVMGSRIKDSNCNSEPNITPEIYTTLDTDEACVDIANEHLPATNFCPRKYNVTGITNKMTNGVASPGLSSEDPGPDIPSSPKPTTPLVIFDTSAVPTLRTDIGVNKPLLIKATATQLTVEEDSLFDVSSHPKPTTPLVVIANTLPDPTAIAIALNQELALKAVTAYQKLHTKKSTTKTGPKSTNMSNNSSNITDAATDVEIVSHPGSLPATTTPSVDEVVTQQPNSSVQIPKNNSNKSKKQSTAKPNTNEPTKPRKESKKRTKATTPKKKLVLRAPRGTREATNPVVSTEQIILTKPRKKRQKTNESEVPGLCPRHHTIHGYKLEDIPKLTSRKCYKVNNLMCSGYFHLETAKQKQECCRSKSTDEDVVMCNKCIHLAETDHCRFFLCKKCHDTYHTGIIKSFCPPTKRIRTQKLQSY